MNERDEALIEWQEQAGVRLMHAMKCTHWGTGHFGDKAVCVTCFDNMQRVGKIMQEQAAWAWQQGRLAERRDWELTADLATPDEGRMPLSNPYRFELSDPAMTARAHGISPTCRDQHEEEA